MLSQPAKILVVDDNPVVLLALSHTLRSAGHEVVEATTGAECLARLRDTAPDLALLDVQLPDVHGVELCQRIKREPDLNQTFVVLLSATEVSTDLQATGLEAGADGYIARPIVNRELLARVAALLRIQRAESALRAAHQELERRVSERTVELSRTNAALREEITIRQKAEKAEQQHAEHLRLLSLRLVDVQESERRAMARELHDEIGQVLTGLKLQLDLCAPQTAGPVQQSLNEARGLVNELMQQVRRLSFDLRPQILDDLGLLPALDWHFKRFTKQTSVCVDFQPDLPEERLPGHLETAVFRIVQEALTNVARHAGADAVAVELSAGGDRVKLQVRDGGRGFTVKEDFARLSSGVAGMRERAELLGGTFGLDSAPGQGTRIAVELPLQPSTPKSLAKFFP